MDDEAEIRRVLSSVNDVWRTSSPGEVAQRIREHFAADAVIVGPDLARVARGRDAVSQSYADFVSNAEILSAELEEPQIDLIADVAVATLQWRMRYEFQGAESSEFGHDVYVFGRHAGRWLILWRKIESRSAQ